MVAPEYPIKPNNLRKTILASFLSILLSIPAFVPATLVMKVYKFFLEGYFMDTWLEKPVLMWFPEVLRGLLVGVIALYVCGKMVKNFNVNAVCIVVFSIYLAITLFGGYFYYHEHGWEITDMVGGIAEMFGLGAGLFEVCLHRKTNVL